MKDISEKISYLQGLSEGLNVADSVPQGKIIIGILGVLDDIANTITNMQTDFRELQAYTESIDDDLYEIQENIMDEEDIDDQYIQLECSNCGEQVYFESDILDDEDVIEVICPECNEVVFINDGSFDYEPYIDNESDLDKLQHPDM